MSNISCDLSCLRQYTEKKKIESSDALYFFENKTFKEIAKIEGISYPTARESVTAAIEILKSKKYF